MSDHQLTNLPKIKLKLEAVSNLTRYSELPELESFEATIIRFAGSFNLLIPTSMSVFTI